MRGAYVNYIETKGMSRYTAAVEAVCAKEKEAAELRLARIFNRAESDMYNGKPPVMEKKGMDKPMHKS